ncbi:unknown protein [Nostoc sp. NIES-3756]|uniref:hypothetical protein n=1 Tax=Nostoc sp. NIES-3756 TaxID=1751286 RepID=UPI0007206DE1|nr:hypothetical protein [Nostoc sp. NIES-3756]BAT56418.1 unknown protein [Nostoc sp. NIES-3756]BAY35830.1 hypothetical protein NIES2111_01470 [Nostoc sp. NIES-2111]
MTLTINKYVPIIATKLAIIASMIVLPLPAKAVTLVTERATLKPNDQIDWLSLGKVLNPFVPNPADFLPNSFSATSEGGLGLKVDIPLVAGVTPPFVFQTTFPPNGIPTNFANGDLILFTGFQPGKFPAVGNPGPLTITFEKPVFGAGTQISVDDTLEFTLFISAFDQTNTLLDTFSIQGTSSLALDNSAQFIGVRSNIPNISRLVFSSSEPNRAFGLNRVSIVAAVPEPFSTLAILAFGVSGIVLKQRPHTGKRLM